MRHTYPESFDMVLMLLEHYEAADHENGGTRWYRESQRFARSLAREHGGGVARPAGIIAALSPQLQWSVNKRIAAHYMEHGEPGEGCLRTSDLKAWAIYNGARPLTVLRGCKTRAFYRAIMGDEDAAVIDTWMLAALEWPRRNGLTPRQYERCASALREAARLAGETTATMQAIVWTHVRGGAE